MRTNAKTNTIVTTRIVSNNPLVLGYTVKGFPEMIFDTTKVHDKMHLHAEIHGWGQRIPDKAAIGRADKDGEMLSETVRLKMKYDGMKAAIEHYESGIDQWAMRVAVGKRETDHSLTLRAMMEKFGKDSAAVEGMLETWVKNGHGTRSAILDSFSIREDIGALIRGYRSEMAKGIDTDSLIEGMSDEA